MNHLVTAGILVIAAILNIVLPGHGAARVVTGAVIGASAVTFAFTWWLERRRS